LGEERGRRRRSCPNVFRLLYDRGTSERSHSNLLATYAAATNTDVRQQEK